MCVPQLIKIWHSKAFFKISEWFGLKPVCAITIVAGFLGLFSLGGYYANSIDKKMDVQTRAISNLGKSIGDLANTQRDIQYSLQSINNTLGIHDARIGNCEDGLKDMQKEMNDFRVSLTKTDTKLDLFAIAVDNVEKKVYRR